MCNYYCYCYLYSLFIVYLTHQVRCRVQTEWCVTSPIRSVWPCRPVLYSSSLLPFIIIWCVRRKCWPQLWKHRYEDRPSLLRWTFILQYYILGRIFTQAKFYRPRSHQKWKGLVLGVCELCSPVRNDGKSCFYRLESFWDLFENENFNFLKSSQKVFEKIVFKVFWYKEFKYGIYFSLDDSFVMEIYILMIESILELKILFKMRTYRKNHMQHLNSSSQKNFEEIFCHKYHVNISRGQNFNFQSTPVSNLKICGFCGFEHRSNDITARQNGMKKIPFHFPLYC